MSFKGIYERTIFKNPDDGFCILSMKTSDAGIPPKARSNRKHNDNQIRFTVTGYGLPETDTVELLLTGEWETSKYGCQLKVETWEAAIPHTEKGIRDYLCSGIIKGLDAKSARGIVERFGVNALQVIENEPERLMEIPGIPPDTLKSIGASHRRGIVIQALTDFLAPFQVSKTAAVKIYEHFGPNSMSIIKSRPFELCRIDGFGFKRVDAIAKTLRRPLNDPMRIRAALLFVLDKSASRDGHLYLERDDLCKKTLALLNQGIPSLQMRMETREVAQVLYSAIERRELIEEDGAVYLPRHYRNEMYVARYVAGTLANQGEGADVRMVLNRAVQSLPVKPSERQIEAVVMAFKNKLSILTGHPGTGKTTVLKLVIDVFRILKPGGTILLTAPTGRASRRMAESTGFDESRTLHSQLGLLTNDEENSHINSREPVEADFIIIDEVSMVDMWLARELFSRIRAGTSILLVGDAGQLPSVGPGNVFKELIECGLIPVTALDQIFRQSENSNISSNAQRIDAEETELVSGGDFIMMEFTNTRDSVDYLVECYIQEVEARGIQNVQILSPYASEGIASTDKLNQLIREYVNPAVEGKAEVRIGKKLFREGDRIMQTRNKNQVFNGDIGFIHAIRDPKGPNTSVVLHFTGNRVVEYDPSELSIIDLSYAMTVHKAMGSEFDAVLLPVLSEHSNLLEKRLLKTAITRARSMLHMTYESHALINAIRNDRSSNRNTRLGYQIKLQYVRLLSGQNAPQTPEHEQLRFTG